MHKGVDFAAERHPIIAAGSGMVREAGWKGSYGKYIRIKHNATYDTAYAHMTRIAPHISASAGLSKAKSLDMWDQPVGLRALIYIMKSSSITVRSTQ